MAKERRRKAEEAAAARLARSSARTTARNSNAVSANASKVSGRTQPRADLVEIPEVHEEQSNMDEHEREHGTALEAALGVKLKELAKAHPNQKADAKGEPIEDDENESIGDKSTQNTSGFMSFLSSVFCCTTNPKNPNETTGKPAPLTTANGRSRGSVDASMAGLHGLRAISGPSSNNNAADSRSDHSSSSSSGDSSSDDDDSDSDDADRSGQAKPPSGMDLYGKEYAGQET